MQRILAATDFSSRSDRAIRRATLLAKQFNGEIVLVHVVDDDQPDSLLKVEQHGAAKMLHEMGRTIRQVDGIGCDAKLNLGEAFQGILDASSETTPDLIVMGEHRRQLLRDIFTGTTAERVIRFSRQPVIMANATPVGFYRRILLAVDFSECSAEAARAVQRLALDKYASVTVMHAFNAHADTLIGRGAMTIDERERYIEEERAKASRELASFLSLVDFKPTSSVVNQGSAAETIRAVAREQEVDLIVLGTHGTSGVTNLVGGSVAQEILRSAERDILLVPPIRE